MLYRISIVDKLLLYEFYHCIRGIYKLYFYLKLLIVCTTHFMVD